MDENYRQTVPLRRLDAQNRIVQAVDGVYPLQKDGKTNYVSCVPDGRMLLHTEDMHRLLRYIAVVLTFITVIAILGVCFTIYTYLILAHAAQTVPALP